MEKIAQQKLPKPNNPSESVPPTPSKKKFVIGFIVFCILLSIVFLHYLSKNEMTVIGTSNGISVQKIATPTPMPFREMTIPYLRDREYKSELGDMQMISDNGSYTSYLTNYTSDGFKVNAFMTVPTGQQPPGWPNNVQSWPAIVFIHGYIPPTLYDTQSQYASYVDYLARNGFAVLKIDLRGHGNSEGEAGGGYYGSDYIIDTLNAVAALQNVSYVDPEKIGLWGHSMAGNVVLRSMAAKPTIPASVIWAGAVYTYLDQQKYGIDDNSYRPPQNNVQRQRKRQELFDKYGSPSAQSVFWQQVIPTNYLHDLQGAIQINHAVDDPVVNIGYSRDLMALLDKTRVPHELHEYPSGGHNIQGNSFNEAMQNTVDFFKKYLSE